MQISTSPAATYRRVVTKLVIYTSLSAIGCILLGYFLLPVASAFYAALIYFENPKNRVASYVIPILFFTLNFFLRGLYSLEALAYVAIGIIICVCYKKKISKGETAFWAILLTVAFMFISAMFIAFEETGAVGVLPIKQFYSGIYHQYRDEFLKTLTGIIEATSDGSFVFIYNGYEAEVLFRELIISIVPIVIVTAFVFIGLALKLFMRALIKHSEEQECAYSWDFKTTSLVAYFYVAIAILSIFLTPNGSIIYFTLQTLNTVFSAVFAYLGVKFLYYIFIARDKSPLFAVIVITIIFVLLSSFAIQIFSYLGVFFNIITNKAISASNNKDD